MSRPGPDDCFIALECCWHVVGNIRGEAARQEVPTDPTMLAILGADTSRPAKSSRIRVWADPDARLEWEGPRFVVTCPACDRRWSMTHDYARRLSASVRTAHPRHPRQYRAGIRVCIPWEAITKPRGNP